MRPESLYFLFSPITRIKGVGGETAKALTRLLPAATALSGSGVPIIRDLLFHLPIGLVDRSKTYPLNSAPPDVVATFVVTVDEHIPPRQKRFGKQPYKVICSNETGDITLVFFNARDDYIKGALPIGAKRVISGHTEHFDFKLQMTHPDIIAPLDKLAEVQKPEPVYPLTIGLSSRRIAKIVSDAIEKLPDLPEWLPTSPLEGEGWLGGKSYFEQASSPPHPNLPSEGEGGLLSWKAALNLAHHPQTEEDLLPTSSARLRLAHDEILANQLHLALLRRAMQEQAGVVVKGNGTLTDTLIASLPFTLTQGQQKVFAEISHDMASGRRMGRLLQGDVGSGKTIVALLAMLKAAEQGLQSALMAPTELIAQQHYEVISALLITNNQQLTSIVLLTGSIKGRARDEALEKIASSEAKIIVGTHALFQDAVEFNNLALVVIDEQHRFGVNQRMALAAKGKLPHVLHMTATPIPRSLTMTLYGDMDISSLREKPAERLPIATRVVPLSRYEEVMVRLKAALDRGEKAYWICPLIEDSGLRIEDSGRQNSSLTLENDLAAAIDRFTEFKARFGDVVGLVHGRMKADERNVNMQKFAGGENKLLVATTVVEVGVDVRDATIMVIEHAERFGLAQLHQLRGRVGRGNKLSSCVLLYNEGIRDQALGIRGENHSSPNAQFLMPNASLARLSILRNTNDGFAIAEEDLKIRGGGDLIGTRQSGLPRFIFTHLFEHQQLLQHAREDIGNFLKSDPEFTSERGKALKLLLEIFGYV